MAETERSFLGLGWHFPPSFSRINHAVQMVSGATDIEQSIGIILRTIPGERLMQPLFGCPTQRFVFEEVDTNFLTDINDAIRHALLMWEPRIKFIGTGISHHNEVDGIVYLNINYSVILTNTRHNIVYPFYLNEGTSLTDAT